MTQPNQTNRWSQNQQESSKILSQGRGRGIQTLITAGPICAEGEAAGGVTIRNVIDAVLPNVSSKFENMDPGSLLRRQTTGTDCEGCEGGAAVAQTLIAGLAAQLPLKPINGNCKY